MGTGATCPEGDETRTFAFDNYLLRKTFSKIKKQILSHQPSADETLMIG